MAEKVNLEEAPGIVPDEVEATEAAVEPSVEVQPEVAEVEKTEPEEEPTAPSEEEQKVPYSRFKKFHDEAIELRREAAERQAEIDALKARSNHIEPASTDGEPTAEWLEMYGDSEASKRAYQLELRRQEAVFKQAEERAIQAVRNEQNKEKDREKENLSLLDNHLESVAAIAGRDLTEKEQSKVLDIIDSYTAKDDAGNYLGAMIPADKAWRIYELEQKASLAPKIESRNKVAAIAAQQTQGSTGMAADKDKDFDPLRWPEWKV